MFRTQLFDHLQEAVLRAVTTFSACLHHQVVYLLCGCMLSAIQCLYKNDSMILFAKIWRKWSIWQKRVWNYLCVCVPNVLICGTFGCDLSLIACGSFASSYNGFGSLTCCSMMSRFCWWCIWMYVFSQWFIFLLFLHGCISFRVLFDVPYSCLLFSICVAYAEAGLLVLMYLICSLCLIVTGLPDCPIYEIKCNTCSKNYVVQSGRPVTIRHREHIRYIKTNNLASNKHKTSTVLGKQLVFLIYF
jgi:hypothetical protein